jgi:hypothetical protein
MVRGLPRHSESNGGVERVNQTVECKIGAWLKDNNSMVWSVGCKIIQWRYNTHYHESIKKTPYEITFGQPPQVGISNLPITSEVLKTLAAKADLNKDDEEGSNASSGEEETSIPKEAISTEKMTTNPIELLGDKSESSCNSDWDSPCDKILKVGDVIEYYPVEFVLGTLGRMRTGTVTKVCPDDDYRIIPNTLDPIPSGCLIK